MSDSDVNPAEAIYSEDSDSDYQKEDQSFISGHQSKPFDGSVVEEPAQFHQQPQQNNQYKGSVYSKKKEKDQQQTIETRQNKTISNSQTNLEKQQHHEGTQLSSLQGHKQAIATLNNNKDIFQSVTVSKLLENPVQENVAISDSAHETLRIGQMEVNADEEDNNDGSYSEGDLNEKVSDKSHSSDQNLQINDQPQKFHHAGEYPQQKNNPPIKLQKEESFSSDEREKQERIYNLKVQKAILQPQDPKYQFKVMQPQNSTNSLSNAAKIDDVIRVKELQQLQYQNLQEQHQEEKILEVPQINKEIFIENIKPEEERLHQQQQSQKKQEKNKAQIDEKNHQIQFMETNNNFSNIPQIQIKCEKQLNEQEIPSYKVTSPLQEITLKDNSSNFPQQSSQYTEESNKLDLIANLKVVPTSKISEFTQKEVQRKLFTTDLQKEGENSILIMSRKPQNEYVIIEQEKTPTQQSNVQAYKREPTIQMPRSKTKLTSQVKQQPSGAQSKTCKCQIM